MTRTRLIAILAALATAVFMSACSNTSSDEAHDGHTDHSHAEETITVTGEPAGFNAADISFADNMIPHHQQAIELTELVPDRSSNPELRELAVQIAAAQDPEINTMKAFLVQWKENPDDATGEGGHGDHAGMAGMVDEATMTRLATLSGPEFDTLWLQSMIAHHEGAVQMAEDELANGSNVDAKALAQTIIDGQQAEIAQMKSMLEGS
ncbi:DUF305 domain-containing protein [[Mycobacterium] burgundiense]|uniref:DUF305 domain-containing protein n=1 Tax=[Mycobacterium] burgundiense TaxID=3064286 RepID=A0ABM9M4L9_9MYCO|nr:DUF305 domain-containing protein [Mycolicibacterium sp. MU0053]CAJ1510100.1 DUF305 domain-containing protein [Mycolicibacterium sp. MU0053]